MGEPGLEKIACFLCRKAEKLLIQKVGIAFGIGGADYAFCGKCLEKPAIVLFKKLAYEQGLIWPLKNVKNKSD